MTSAIKYLTFDQVVNLNRRHCGDGAGVRDEGLIRSQLGRVEASFGGADLYPTVLEKAAVLLHGLSSTQGFHDGNKRTAWLATDLFLSTNSTPVRDLPPIEAEAMILAVATRAFESEDEPTRGVVKAWEWLDSVKLTAADRLDYAIVAHEAAPADGGTFLSNGAQTGGFWLSDYPAVGSVAVICRIKWHQLDIGAEWEIRCDIECEDERVQLQTPSVEALELLELGVPGMYLHPSLILPYFEEPLHAVPDVSGRHASGVIPSLYIPTLFLHAQGPSEFELVLRLNGEVMARRPLRAHRLVNAPQWVPFTD